MNQIKTLICGASGLTGSALMQFLLNNNSVSEIISLQRNHSELKHPKINEILTDFSEEHLSQLEIKADILFCCIGTTIKKAGTKDNFRKVDFEIPLKLGKLSINNRIDKFIMISSIGAKSKSSNFYLKTKGEVEDEIIKLGIPHIYIVRPSLLLGERKEKRIGEKAGQILARIFGFILLGPLKRYKAIHANDVAKAMIKIVEENSARIIYENEELFRLAKDYKPMEDSKN